MSIITTLINFILHIDSHLVAITSQYGLLTYAILFIIIFCETGLVILPLLPGDSLLFAAGAIAALGSLNIVAVVLVLVAAAIIGDTVNYWIGHFFGQALVDNPWVPIKQSHIDKTQAFYAKYGGKTIILARFVPIVRTFAPFVAGVGKMHYRTFITYNIIGGVAWATLVTLAGYFFGNIPVVKENFSLVVILIVVISVAPMIFEAVKHQLTKKTV